MTTAPHPGRRTRPDRIYFTPAPTLADVDGTRVQFGPDRYIYVIEPVGDVEPDPEGASALMCPEALVIAIAREPR